MIGLSLSRTLRRVSGSFGCKLEIPLHSPSCAAWFSAQAASLPAEGLAGFDSHSYAAALQECVRNGDVLAGKSVHCEALKRGDCLDFFASNIHLNLYAKSELFRDADHLFNEMPMRNTVSFVTLIQAYGQAQQFGKAVELFSRMHGEGHELNPFAFTSFLKLLGSMERAELGRSVHACVVKLGHDRNAFVGTALIDAYSLCGDVFSAK